VNPVTKLVAWLLALVLFALPTAALGSCRGGAAMPCQRGSEHCPMMYAHQDAGGQASETPAGDGSCCQVSSGPETSARLAINQERRTSVPALSWQPAVTGAALVPTPVESPPAPVFIVDPSPQALLCTFLV